MQQRSIPLARTLGAAALLSTAAAWGAAWIRYEADAPRLDILVPLALAAVFVVGWLLASRSAPPVEPLPATAPPREEIPGKLGAVRRDWGFFAAACLTVWAPYVAARTAYGDGGSVLGSLYCLLAWLFGVVLSLSALGLLKNQLGPGQRMLRKDAAAGRVHAVRVRFGTPVRESYRYPTGSGVGQVATSSTYYVELVPEAGAEGRRTVRLQAMSGYNFRIAVGDKHLAQAAARLVGHGGWLYWPTRWRDIAGTDKQRRVSAAFVSDSGHVVWGVTPEEDHTEYLRAGVAPVRETDTALAVAPLPRPSRYIPKVHASHLRVAALGALLAVPFLLGVVPYWAGLLLGVISGAVGLFAGMTMDGVGVDQEPWTVRKTSHPALR
ncbi:hypothetical protein [Streptomyces sp. 35G-GA-8]|uniref:hypothetical protein n=1 Tax=Streptomyces sp. 35G-GA-8 TaxID=2939434 RepID=UPI00201F9517|nr:hypothetical protein [Streptomyces sp. 35G-GA-8]MCL7380356.1 hypothetical protein [Streptomyces sp. 35G-GA-8]